MRALTGCMLGTGLKCLSYRESNIGTKIIKAGTNSRCSYRDVCLIEVSIMRELTKCMLGTGPKCLSLGTFHLSEVASWTIAGPVSK